MWALGLLGGPNEKNRTHYQEIFAKRKAFFFFYCMDRHSTNEVVAQRSQAEPDGRGREGEQESKLGDRNPPEPGPRREKRVCFSSASGHASAQPGEDGRVQGHSSVLGT